MSMIRFLTRISEGVLIIALAPNIIQGQRAEGSATSLRNAEMVSRIDVRPDADAPRPTFEKRIVDGSALGALIGASLGTGTGYLIICRHGARNSCPIGPAVNGYRIGSVAGAAWGAARAARKLGCEGPSSAWLAVSGSLLGAIPLIVAQRALRAESHGALRFVLGMGVPIAAVAGASGMATRCITTSERR